MTPATPTKTPELMLGLGAVAAGAGLVLGLATLFYSAPRMAALRERGLVVEARVKDKDVEVRSGRRSRRTDYFVEVAFDPKAGKPFAEWGAPPPPPPPPAPGAKYDPLAKLKFTFAGGGGAAGGSASARINVGRTRFDALSSGDALAVAYLADSPEDALGYEHVRDYRATPMLILSGLMALVGGAVAAVGHRRRASLSPAAAPAPSAA